MMIMMVVDFFYNYNFGDFYNGGDFYNFLEGDSHYTTILFWKAILTTQRYFSGRRLSLHNDKIIAKNIAKIIAEIIAKIITENYS